MNRRTFEDRLAEARAEDRKWVAEELDGYFTIKDFFGPCYNCGRIHDDTILVRTGYSKVERLCLPCLKVRVKP